MIDDIVFYNQLRKRRLTSMNTICFYGCERIGEKKTTG